MICHYCNRDIESNQFRYHWINPETHESCYFHQECHVLFRYPDTATAIVDVPWYWIVIGILILGLLVWMGTEIDSTIPFALQ